MIMDNLSLIVGLILGMNLSAIIILLSMGSRMGDNDYEQEED